jgi:hypothetical protein
MSDTRISRDRQILAGTWEEIVQRADHLAGKQARVEVLHDRHEKKQSSALPFYATATPEQRARAWEEWCHLPRPRVPPLSDEAISRESIYSPEPD